MPQTKVQAHTTSSLPAHAGGKVGTGPRAHGFFALPADVLFICSPSEVAGEGGGVSPGDRFPDGSQHHLVTTWVPEALAPLCTRPLKGQDLWACSGQSVRRAVGINGEQARPISARMELTPASVRLRQTRSDCSRSNVQGGAWGTGPVWGVGKTFPEHTTLTETSISRQGWEKCRGDEGVGVARRPEVGRSLGRRLPETERPRGCGKRAGAEALGGRLGQATESSAGRVQCSGPLSKGSGRLSAGLCGPVRRTHQNRDSSRRLLQKPGER